MDRTSRPKPLDLTNLPGGPAPGTELARLDDIADGAALVLTFGEGTSRSQIFILRKGNDVFGYENSCPHARHPLDWTPGQFLDPSGHRLQCSSHGARFRIVDGYCVAGPCKGKYLRTVALVVEGGLILTPS